MMFDMNQPVVSDEVETFAEWVFAALPVQPTVRRETIILTGSAGNRPSITGTADQKEG